MPNYDYQCLNCGLVFIAMVSFKERDIEKVLCPSCREQNTERVWRTFPGVPKASYLDGTKRFEGLKTEAKLRAARDEKRPSSTEYREISKEITERNKRGD